MEPVIRDTRRISNVELGSALSHQLNVFVPTGNLTLDNFFQRRGRRNGHRLLLDPRVQLHTERVPASHEMHR